MTEEIIRFMPDQVDLGRRVDGILAEILLNAKDYKTEEHYDPNATYIMGYKIPKWQRGLVWSKQQKIHLIESLWKGISIGTYTFNRYYDKPELDDVLIDGQQRMYALQCYLEDEFPVFGYRFSEITKFDNRRFNMLHFPAYITNYKTEEPMKEYYNLMNFSGVSHKEADRA